MPDFQILKTEIDTDPLTRGYSGMTDQQVANSMNAKNRDNWVPLSSAQIFEAINRTEFAALNTQNISRVDRILGLGSGIPTEPGSNARDELVAVFGAGSNTIIRLAALANQQRSRGEEIGWGEVRPGDVVQARAL